MPSAEGWKMLAVPPSSPGAPLPGRLLPANRQVGCMSYTFIAGVSYCFFFIVLYFFMVITFFCYFTITFFPFMMYRPLERVPFTVRPSMV